MIGLEQGEGLLPPPLTQKAGLASGRGGVLQLACGFHKKQDDQRLQSLVQALPSKRKKIPQGKSAASKDDSSDEVQLGYNTVERDSDADDEIPPMHCYITKLAPPSLLIAPPPLCIGIGSDNMLTCDMTKNACHITKHASVT